MDETVESRKKERSPSFPFISLPVALERAKEFYAQEKRGSAPFEVAAKHWRYSPASSGALQTVAALKQYGLMQDEGVGKQRKVRLTELALRILLDTREDSVERDQYKLLAAMSPTVVAEIYEKWSNELPSDATLNHFLVLDKQFGQGTAAKVVEIIKSNEEFTGIDRAVTMSLNQDNAGDDMDQPMSKEQGWERKTAHAMIASNATQRVVDTLVQRQIHTGPGVEVGSFPVAKNCIIRLLATGPLTESGVKVLIQQLQLGVDAGIFDSDPKPTDGSNSA